MYGGETLHRHLSFWNNLTFGFAMVSPVVGLYIIIGVQTALTGGGRFTPEHNAFMQG